MIGYTRRVLWLLFGLSLGSAGAVLACICPGAGQCAHCGACLPALPLAVLPLLAFKKSDNKPADL